MPSLNIRVIPPPRLYQSGKKGSFIFFVVRKLLDKGNMRIISILVALAVVYVLYAKHGTASPDLNEALKPQLGEQPTLPTAPPAHSVYKQALDRANSVADQVRQQQKDNSF
ncbi:MAG: hypothetical protein QM796_15670 [Chthoniobacteraceae bacterium]